MIFDLNRVEEEAAWDGLHGVITNENDESARDLIGRYKKLWVIEESFKINKSTLEMRPIFHFTPRRIEAHILICYLAYALSRYVQAQVSQFYKMMSVEKIKSELKRVSSSILESEEGQQFKMPCQMSEDAQGIYKSFGMKRKRHPEKIESRKCSVSKKNQIFDFQGDVKSK